MMSRTRTVFGRRFGAATFVTMSRSVTIPEGTPPSMTMRLPILGVPERFNEKAGAFVTLNTHPESHLRGCIGYPSPFFPLVKALVKAAEGACEDPRFPPLQEDEVARVVVEVSLLTHPELLTVKKPKEYAK